MKYVVSVLCQIGWRSWLSIYGAGSWPLLSSSCLLRTFRHVAGCSAGSYVPRHLPCLDLTHHRLVTEAQPVSSGTEQLVRNGPPVRLISCSRRRKQCGLSKRCILFISQRWVTSKRLFFQNVNRLWSEPCRIEGDVSISCVPWYMVLDHGEGHNVQVPNDGGVNMTC
jgi:hypothetical protein